MTQSNYGNAAEIFQRWFTVNEEFLNASIHALEELGKDPSHLDDTYRKELQNAREAVRKTLELEREAIDTIESDSGCTLPLNGLTELTGSMARSGIDLRARLWEAWFDQAESLGSSLSRSLQVLSTFALPPSIDKTMHNGPAQGDLSAQTSPASGRQGQQNTSAPAAR
ncbi:hypothetical protein [Sediminicurvatus halobius]|uniref:hypothetical protein n=1 Tax=Sediminicurvatus halobius TaxID=2182432 RepID=UPI0011B1ECCE|nr:hypothetical protein [Spiribacter halobius]UEX79181.1 hypothetical protein LMH63_05960 [Spiribacter halobius]